jgi:maltose alpha-D-glucosyltransferase/alpha-amylase
MRTHGKLRLEHVLWTGRDFAIVDFEGEPRQAISARRLKRAPLRDVASMIRSFHAAGAEGLARHAEHEGVSPDALTTLETWVRYWSIWVASDFLKAYLRALEPGSLLPRSREDLGGLLFVYLLEEVLQTLGRALGDGAGSLPLLLRELHRIVETER